MGYKLTEPNATGGTTDHSEEVAEMEKFVAITMAEDDVPYGMFLETLICKAASALLQDHDSSGGSLDHWTGPRELVIQALTIIGKDEEDLISNGV